MRKPALICVALTSVLALASSGTVAAGRKPVNHFHVNIVEQQFDNGICGVDVVSDIRGVANITTFSDNTIIDNFEATTTYTNPVTNKTIVGHIAQHSNYVVDNPVNNGDGTVTYTFTYRGLAFQVRILHGPVLTRDAGAVTVKDTFTVDANGNITGFVSETLSGLHGPHPDFLDGFQNACDVIVKALT